MGYQADKFNRKYLLVTCGIMWNLVCLSGYYAKTYDQLLYIRIVFAMISSIHTPACVSLINDYYKHESRSRANSVYVTAVSLGVGFANLTSILNQKIGWRNCILVVSGIGLFFSFLSIFLKEPRR